MITLIKGENKKILDDNSGLIPLLKGDGWIVEGEEIKADDELAKVKAEAEALGLKVHHKAGIDKIKAMIEEASK